MMVRREVLRQSDRFSTEVGSDTPVNLKYIFRFGCVIFPGNVLSKQKHAMYHGIRKPRGFRVR